MKARRGSRRYGSTLSLTFGLDGGGWLMASPGRFNPGNNPVYIAWKATWSPGSIWMGAENVAPTGIRSPDRPARSKSLYRLSYPAHNECMSGGIMGVGMA